ncbi:MAG: 23S rRNA (pseudouridine(1915)-N(3))-methyltransferase RlmH [bacterium]|nr:23S rRNA (pseudouridine(1915)-N(3))-methyltransferase RlmH [bacterium]
MLKVSIIAVGKGKVEWVESASAHYEKLLKKYAAIETIILSSRKDSTRLSPDQIRKAELERIMPRLGSNFTVALTDRGTQFDSHKFAKNLQKWREQCGGRMQFLIGGAYGLDQSLLNQADARLSLSPLTFSHQLVRPILLEQLFRAFSILQGTDYHK